MELDLVDAELGLEDARRENSAAEDVLVRGAEVVLLDVVRSVEEVFGTVYQLVLVRTFEAFLKGQRKKSRSLVLVSQGIENLAADNLVRLSEVS